MTDHLPVQTDEAERKDLPEITKFPSPLDQQLVDCMLRDPLTSAGEHLQALKTWDGGEGYKSLSHAATAAWKRLQKPEVQAYLRIQQERIRRAADLEQNDLLEHIVAIIHTDITQVASWGADGKTQTRPSEELPTHARKAIKKLETKTTRRYFKDGDMEETTNTKIELYSRMEAIELFAKVAGVLKDAGGNVNVQNGVIIMPATKSEEEVTKGKTIHEG